ncbi:MAG: exodeoxyribonuclease VII large subunit [Alphaproteobacteria bacterium]
MGKERGPISPHPVLPFFQEPSPTPLTLPVLEPSPDPVVVQELTQLPQVEPPPFSVSSLSFALKKTLESVYGQVRVKGEISGLKAHGSGHLYFSLKDDQAVLDAVCWRGTGSRLSCKPVDGLEVIALGKITSYPGRSKYQIVVEDLQLTGEGSLLKLLEERKRKLLAEGLFDPARKKKLPTFPKTIGLITSPTGAVIQDILHRLQDRFPLQVYLWPVAVQGEQAVPQICEALEGFRRLFETGKLCPDLLIVARGGGSLEDLWAFNEEAVVRAAVASPIPLISAIGHETDTTLIDHVADQRAPTPTAAAEIAVPERKLVLQRLQGLEGRLQAIARRHLETVFLKFSFSQKQFPKPEALLGPYQQRLDDAHEKLSSALWKRLDLFQQTWERLKEALRQPDGRLELARVQLEQKIQKLQQSIRFCLQQKIQRFYTATKILESVSYTKTLERGFCFITAQEGELKSRAQTIEPGSQFRIHFADGQLEAQALDKTNSGDQR